MLDRSLTSQCATRRCRELFPPSKRKSHFHAFALHSDVSAHAGGSTVTPSSSGGPPRGVVAGGRSDTAATVAGGGAGVAVPGVGLSKEQEVLKMAIRPYVDGK